MAKKSEEEAVEVNATVIEYVPSVPVDVRARNMADELIAMIGEELDGVKGALVENMLYDYGRVCAQLEDVNARVDKFGYTITNFHGKVERNPDLTTQHQLMAEKSAMIPKIMKYLPADKVDEDELVKFLNGAK